MQLLVYTQRLSPRVEYIFSTLLSAIGVSNFSFTSDKDVFAHAAVAKLNYSQHSITNEELHVVPAPLLFENTIKEQAIKCFEFNRAKAFFKTGNDFPFDIFAASFYLITRYEEYLPHKLDMYGRYAHENSLAYKQGFLKEPVVNIWLQYFSKALLSRFPSLRLSPSAFRVLPTYDIDIAWSYKNKGAIRNAGGLINSIIESEWNRISERLNVLFGSQKDPFDSYDWLSQLHERYLITPSYFFLLAKQSKGYDKNILPSNVTLQKLIQEHAVTCNPGIHPSWQSGDKPELLKEEKKTLEKITGKPVFKSRQHYIRLTLPDTYRRLIEAGITEDYSMGYGSINGFRASYCLPFKWYDLQTETITPLTVFPFCYMDANSYYEQRYTSDEALEEMMHYYQTIKEVNGLFITIWHNHFVGSDTTFAGWKEAYETFIKKISSDQGITSL